MKTFNTGVTGGVLIIFVSLIAFSAVNAQTHYVDVRFDASGAECSDAGDCFVSFTFQVQGQSANHVNVDFGEVKRIPVGGGHSGTPFAIEGKIDCVGEPLHCNFVSENHNMPAINGSIQLDQGTYVGQMWYCQEYPMTQPTITGGDCTSAIITLNIATDGEHHRWQASLDGASWLSIPGATTMHEEVNLTDLNTLFATNVAGRPLRFRCIITDCYARNSPVTNPAVTLYSPSPTATVEATPATCYGGNGELKVSITSSGPGIDDFFLSVYGEGSDISISTHDLHDAPNYTFTGIPSGVYDVVVRNNTNSTVLGDCSVTIENKSISQPEKVEITAFHAVAAKCKGSSNGQITITTVTGGSGTGYIYYFNNVEQASNIKTGLSAGTHTIKAKDSKACMSDETSVTVGEPPNAMKVEANPKNYRGFQTSCYNSNDAEITATPSHHNGAVIYTWYKDNAKINGATGNKIIQKEPATYYVVATDDNECTAQSEDVVIVEPPEINFTIAPEGTLTCPSDATITLKSTLDVTTITGPATYTWTGPNIPEGNEDEANLLNIGVGTYSLTVADNQGCATTKNHPVAPPEVFTASLAVDAPIKCNGDANGVLGVTLLNGSGTAVSGEHYEWYRNGAIIPSASGATFDQGDDALYRVVVTYKGRCTTDATYTLSDPDPVTGTVSVPSITVHHGNHISCPGELDGSLHVSPTGGNGAPFTYEWSTGEDAQSITGKGAGVYTVTVRDHKGCPGTASGELIDPDPITPDISLISNYNGFPIKCHNASDGHLRASASGGTNDFTYVWNTGPTTADLTNIGPGTYTVTATDENGCSNAISQEVIPPAQVTTSIAVMSNYHGQAISCHNLSDAWLQATGAGGTNTFTHTWSTGLIDPDLSGIPAGTYTVTTTDANGCPATAEITIENPDPVMASIDSVAVYNGYGVRCHGDHNGYIETSATGGTQQYTFSWTGTSSTTNIAEELGVGSYTITIADENGCADSRMQVITEPDALSLGVAADEHITCFDGSTGAITLSSSGGAGLHEYSIDGGAWQTSQEFISLQARGYTLSVMDRNDCITHVSHTLTQPDEINIGFTTMPAFCADPRGEASATVAGGVGSYRYEWFDEDNTSLGTDTFIEKLYAGVYTLTVHDGNDCPMTKSVGIVASDGAQAQARETIPASCSYSSDGVGELEIISGTGPFEFTWPDGQTGARGVDLRGGTYLVGILDGNSCKTIYPIVIPAPSALDAEAVEITDVSCHGNCDGSITVEASGGVGNYQFDWTDQTGAQAVGLCAGDHAVVVTDGNGCVFEKTFTTLQPTPLAFTPVERTLPLCNGDCNGSLEVEALGGNGAYQYAWTSGSSAALAQGLCAGDYTLTVTDGKHCVLERTYNLGQPPPLRLLLSEQTQPTCFGGCDGAVQVQTTGGTGAYDYAWTNALATPRIVDLCAGNYSVTATDDNNCVISQTYTITNPPALTIDLGGSVTLCVGQTHTLDAGTSWATYAWNSNTGFTASTQDIEIIDPGQYWLEVYNADGCVARDTFLLENSLDLLEASFLIPKEAVVQDTVAIIDVSWPLPDQTEWSFPVAMRKVIDLGEVVFGQFDEPGIYEVGLTTYLAKCTDHISKTILILKGSEEPEGGRLGHDEYVKEFTLYPNPTEGNFEVKVEFADEGPAMLSVWNTPIGYMVKKVQDEGKKTYNWYMDLRPLSAGTYVIRLDHAKGRKYIRFVVR